MADITTVVDGYTIIASLGGVGQVNFTVNKPDGSLLFRASDPYGLNNGLNTLVNRATDAGNTELANQLIQLRSDLMGQADSIAQQVRDANRPPKEEPVPPTTENKTDPNAAGNSTANDDKQTTATPGTSTTSTQGNTETATTTPTTTTPTTQAGSSNTTASTTNNPPPQNTGSSAKKPGTRLNNPLGNFSSYTYQLTLYMITPDAHTAFVASGRKDINAFAKSGANSGSGGAYVILQSGGVNTKLDQRPPDMKYDYYIDDLRITNAVSTQQTATSSNITKITFNIIEPVGFSLITKLKRARETLLKTSKIPNIEKATNASKQFFVLGIRFQGYDANGEIATASKYFSDDTINKSPDASGVYERFYDIMIEKMTFKLGGGSTVYSVTAKNIASEVGLHVARGTVDANVELVADTVGNALEGSGKSITSLFQTMNNNLSKLKDAGSREFPDVYAVRWLGFGVDNIKNATLKSAANPDKKASAPSSANNASQVTDAVGQKATYDKQKIKISITQGTSILQAIQQIIKQSSYLEDALETLYKSEETPNEDTASPDVVEQKDTPALRWYNVSTEIEVIGFDTKINDFAYKITYVIQPYDTPAAVSPNGRTTKYYGPHKRYEYWYTGKNKEILSYEQQYDNTFFNVTYNANGDPAASGGNATIAQLSGKPTNEVKTGRLSPGTESQNTYMTSLYDPGAYAQAKIQILGDPDYLMRETAPGINEVYQQFYGSDGFTINPNGGQVFIEIAFNEGIDYDITKGTLDLNESIFFWDYPDNVKSKIKGVSYQVRECESVFKGGKFTQTLQLNINTMPDAIEAAEKAATDNRPAQSTQNSPIRPINNERGSTVGATPTPGINKNTGSINSGLITDNLPKVNSAIGRNLGENAITPRTGTFATNTIVTNNADNPIVANDDSVSNSGFTQSGSANRQKFGMTIVREPINTTTITDVRNGET
jgi:hypothetical protein